jgi:hypothetical protein
MQATLKPASREKWHADFLKADTSLDWVQHSKAREALHRLVVQDFTELTLVDILSSTH